MDSCEEDVIIACGLYLLSEEEEGEKLTGPHPEFSLGGRGDDSESIYNLCLILKIML
jgi:hypothetical protein